MLDVVFSLKGIFILFSHIPHDGIYSMYKIKIVTTELDKKLCNL